MVYFDMIKKDFKKYLNNEITALSFLDKYHNDKNYKELINFFFKFESDQITEKTFIKRITNTLNFELEKNCPNCSSFMRKNHYNDEVCDCLGEILTRSEIELKMKEKETENRKKILDDDDDDFHGCLLGA
jgi:predicted nucleic acid binding AN1-type Zn finger protein